MISYLEGEVIFTGSGSVVVKVGGIGYRVYNVDFEAKAGELLEIFIYDLIREDRRELFGFKEQAALDFFEKLISINGVGPKSAQKIMSVSTHQMLVKNILRADVAYLVSLPGLGKKTAQKIILEMKGVLTEDEVVDTADGDVIDALVSLGYARKDVLEMVSKLTSDSTDDKIREALMLLGN